LRRKVGGRSPGIREKHIALIKAKGTAFQNQSEDKGEGEAHAAGLVIVLKSVFARLIFPEKE
jgi:hypothetical protein